MITQRKARKPHDCIYCKNQIPIGAQYIEEKNRFPTFTGEFEQVGIEYRTNRQCVECFNANSIYSIETLHVSIEGAVIQ